MRVLSSSSAKLHDLFGKWSYIKSKTTTFQYNIAWQWRVPVETRKNSEICVQLHKSDMLKNTRERERERDHVDCKRQDSFRFNHSRSLFIIKCDIEAILRDHLKSSQYWFELRAARVVMN